MAWTWASKMVDPIAYRAEEQGNITPNTDLKADWTYDPAKLKNPDDSLNMYWDDSSEANYKNPATVWGRAEKYTWEWVKTSDVAYNPDITTKDLNPDYLYGREAQMYGSENNWYISERNDNIASALYNEWRVSKQEVADFLNKQKWFQNSTEEERLNTIESVWKRLWKVAWDGNENENKTDWNTEWDNSALKNMEEDLLKDTTGKLYGKNTADDNDIIKTLQDSNSVERRMAESRIKNFKQLQATSSDALAAAIVSWTMATDTQAMTDLMQYDPAKYQEVQEQIKVIRWQMNINVISTWEWDFITSATNWESSLNNEKADFVSDNASWTKASELLQSVNSSLSSNVAASTASEQMANLEADMAALQNRMKGLKWEARKLFKWDVPQYIVNAYVANRTQEIQDQLSQLESRYNMAYSRYQQEWEQTKWNAEYSLKQEELNIKKQSIWLDDYVKRNTIAQWWYELEKKYWTAATTTANWGLPTTQLTRADIEMWVDELIKWCTDWTLGKAQCAAGIQKYYLPYLWVNLWTLSKWSEKQGICNEFYADWYVPSKWDLIVMQGSKPEYWHIGIVTWVDTEKWVINYLDWNGSLKDWKWTETAALRSIPMNNNKVYGYYNPTKTNNQMSSSNTYNPDVLEWHWNTYDLAWYYWWKDLSEAAKETVRWLLTYQIAPDDLPKTWENWVYKTQVLNAASAIGREQWWTSNRAKQANDYIKQWNKALNQWWVGSANSTAASLLWELSSQFKEFNSTDIQLANSIINRMTNELWWTGKLATYADLRVAAAEVAKALKGNASATEKEVEDMKNLLSWKMSNAQAQEVFKHFAKDLLDKNASEAEHYRKVVWYKPDSIYLEEVTDWMNDELWIDMWRYYNYQSKWWELSFLDTTPWVWSINYISQL